MWCRWYSWWDCHMQRESSKNEWNRSKRNWRTNWRPTTKRSCFSFTHSAASKWHLPLHKSFDMSHISRDVRRHIPCSWWRLELDWDTRSLKSMCSAGLNWCEVTSQFPHCSQLSCCDRSNSAVSSCNFCSGGTTALRHHKQSRKCQFQSRHRPTLMPIDIRTLVPSACKTFKFQRFFASQDTCSATNALRFIWKSTIFAPWRIIQRRLMTWCGCLTTEIFREESGLKEIMLSNFNSLKSRFKGLWQ